MGVAEFETYKSPYGYTVRQFAGDSEDRLSQPAVTPMDYQARMEMRLKSIELTHGKSVARLVDQTAEALLQDWSKMPDRPLVDMCNLMLKNCTPDFLPVKKRREAERINLAIEAEILARGTAPDGPYFEVFGSIEE